MGSYLELFTRIDIIFRGIILSAGLEGCAISLEFCITLRKYEKGGRLSHLENGRDSVVRSVIKCLIGEYVKWNVFGRIS